MNFDVLNHIFGYLSIEDIFTMENVWQEMPIQKDIQLILKVRIKKLTLDCGTLSKKVQRDAPLFSYGDSVTELNVHYTIIEEDVPQKENAAHWYYYYGKLIQMAFVNIQHLHIHFNLSEDVFAMLAIPNMAQLKSFQLTFHAKPGILFDAALSQYFERCTNQLHSLKFNSRACINGICMRTVPISLKTLHLTFINEHVYQYFRRNPNLYNFRLALGFQRDQCDLAELCPYMKNVESLEIECIEIANLQELAKLNNLKYLSIQCGQLDDEKINQFLQLLATKNLLQYLQLISFNFELTIKTIQCMQKFTKLKTLILEDFQIRQHLGIFSQTISNWTNLVRLELSISQKSGDLIDFAGNLKNVVHLRLELYGCFKNISSLSKMPNLKHLNLLCKTLMNVEQDTELNAFIQTIARANQLKSLRLELPLGIELNTETSNTLLTFKSLTKLTYVGAINRDCPFYYLTKIPNLLEIHLIVRYASNNELNEIDIEKIIVESHRCFKMLTINRCPEFLCLSKDRLSKIRPNVVLKLSAF